MALFRVELHSEHIAGRHTTRQLASIVDRGQHAGWNGGIKVIAVQKVMLGKKYITASIAEKLASLIEHDSDKPIHEILSDREFSVLKFLASGKSISEIAEMLFLSITTVSTYRSRILHKMNLKNNSDLTMYAIENKLI